jgi:hypothetical protein
MVQRRIDKKSFKGENNAHERAKAINLLPLFLLLTKE